MGSPPRSTSDAHFEAIELMATETDRLAQLLDKFEMTFKNIDGNLLVLKAQQEEIISEQQKQSKKLTNIESRLEHTTKKLDGVKTSVDDVRQNIGGVTGLAKSALDAATKPTRKSIRPPRLRVAGKDAE